jgi:fused signal recognition particle receptor
MGFFEKLKNGLRKTKNSMMGKIEGLLKRFSKIDEELFEELEETLILCDIGVNTSVKICEELRERVKKDNVKEPEKIRDMLKDVITDMLGEDQPLDMSTTPSVILVIGVNGVGKTTTIGKLSYSLHQQGKKVIVAAADTFRAAAIDQLEVWTQRAGVDIIKHNEGSDPAAVVFDALTAAKSRKADVVICDTAGRLHNKKNLMDELKKIARIVHQQAEGCALEVLLALDATTGQNAVNQAKQFNEVADITGIILTKLDGTAKGGIVISITDDLKIPVKLITVGEQIDDLQNFVAKDFVDALFEE